MALTPLAVDGYFLVGHGLSVHGTGLLRACEAAGIPAVPVLVDDVRIAGFAPADPAVSCAPEPGPLPLRVDTTQPESLAYRIAVRTAPEAAVRAGLWVWEVEDWFPPGWEAAFAHVDEVWTVSEHAAAALRRVAGDRPVHVVGLPVERPAVRPRPRAALGLPEGFLFLATLDLASSVDRKNPFGAIDAFARAFPPGAGAALVLKTTSGDFVPDRLDALRAAAARHRDIHVIDGRIPAADRDELFASCDCYVSLHRAEGLGLGMAEAMALGKPVIATGYSGNLDYMDTDSAYLVRWERTAVVPDLLYAGGTWAEPDTAHAAELMREVHGAPDAAAERGRRAAERIAATLTPAVVGARVKARVTELAARLEVAPTPPAPEPLAARVRAIPFWWHSIDLGGGVVTPGRKDLALLEAELAGMRLPDLRGRSVLDIGTWDGAFAFAAERLGAARVVALDSFVWELPVGADPDTPPDGPLPGRAGFDLAHATLGSAVEPVHLDFATGDLAAVGTFDVVLFLGVLYHLEDPLGGLCRLRGLTDGLAVIESEAAEWPGHEELGLAELFPTDERGGDPTNWWAPSRAGLVALCHAAGFSEVEIVRGPPAPAPGTDGPTRYRLLAHARP